MSSDDIAVSPYNPDEIVVPSDEERTEVPLPVNDDISAPSPVAAAAAQEAMMTIDPSMSVEVSIQQDGCNTAPTATSTPNINNNNDNTEPQITTFTDHFTLNIPSSVIRYRDLHSAARVLESHEAQFVLEETYDDKNNKHNVSIRRIQDTSPGVRFLRISYATVTAFWTGFLFVFCLQLLLFLFLDLAIQVGATSKQDANVGKAIGAILAFPGFVYGLSSALVIAGAYIKDTWSGHYLIRNFTFKKMDSATVEWIFFCFFLGVPILIMCITMLSQNDRWWEITLLFWFSSIALFYAIFTANVVFYEMRACWEVTKNKNHKDNDSWYDLILRSIVSRQIHQYSGRRIITYIAMGSIRDAEYTDSKSSRNNEIPETRVEKLSWFTKLTMWDKLEEWGLYETVKDEEQIYTVDDARDVRPYITSHTWNLEKIFCRPRNSRYIAIIRGPGALTMRQLKSSIACSCIGIILIFLAIISLLVYLNLGFGFIIIILLAGALIVLPAVKSSYRLYKLRRDLMIGYAKINKRNYDTEAGAGILDTRTNEKESECIYFTKEEYRVTRPTIKFCWIIFVLEFGIFFIYPLVALFSVGNYPLAIMFWVFAGITMWRHYVNAAVVLEETGRMDLVDGENELELWKNQSRLNEIIGNITRGRSRNVWMSILGFLGFIFLALMLGAVGTQHEDIEMELSQLFTYDFEYIQTDSLRYPTCQLTNNLGDSPLTSMADFAFLAGVAYRGEEITQDDLDGWFGEGVAVYERDTVNEFRQEFDTSSAVSFKLVTFPNSTNWAYIVIRGTTNPWDMLTDAQLWSAAALMQVHRELLPFGIIWTPIIDQLIQAITKVESESIEAVSFYKDTTKFAEYLKGQNITYGGIAITGHSLGGGLSMITGAQTGLPAVALSGPNAMLSRRSFDPPITAEDLNSKTFNIIPDRDLVPQIDDKAQNWQGIRCEAAFADVIGCHNSLRSLCEIMYSCGTNGRPFLCACYTEFNYPLPVRTSDSNLTISFEEACGIEE